jgi:hypothetical protein
MPVVTDTARFGWGGGFFPILRQCQKAPQGAWFAKRAELSPGAWSMLDILMIALALGFFALSVGYTVACDRL